MKSLENKYYIFIRLLPILFFAVVIFDLILYFYFDENLELTIKVIALSLGIFILLVPLLFLVLNHNSKKLNQFIQTLKASIDKREFCVNPTKIQELDIISDEINKLLDQFYKNIKNLRTLQENNDSVIRELKSKLTYFEFVINNQSHGIAIFKDGILDFANTHLLNILGLPSINEFHKNKYRLLDYFEKSQESNFFDGYQDDSWCLMLSKLKEKPIIKIAGVKYLLDHEKLSSDTSIVMINFIKQEGG